MGPPYGVMGNMCVVPFRVLAHNHLQSWENARFWIWNIRLLRCRTAKVISLAKIYILLQGYIYIYNCRFLNFEATNRSWGIAPMQDIQVMNLTDWTGPRMRFYLEHVEVFPNHVSRDQQTAAVIIAIFRSCYSPSVCFAARCSLLQTPCAPQARSF